MSQHLATATLDGRPVEIVAGFDRRLGDYFLQVIDERNDMLYTSLQEPLLDWTDIATLRTKVAAGLMDGELKTFPATDLFEAIIWVKQ